MTATRCDNENRSCSMFVLQIVVLIFATCLGFKSKQDGKKHGPGVKQKITEIYDKHAKRKNLEETERGCAEKRQKHIDAREEALLCPAPVGVMQTMRSLRQTDVTRN